MEGADALPNPSDTLSRALNLGRGWRKTWSVPRACQTLLLGCLKLCPEAETHSNCRNPQAVSQSWLRVHPKIYQSLTSNSIGVQPRRHVRTSGGASRISIPGPPPVNPTAWGCQQPTRLPTAGQVQPGLGAPHGRSTLPSLAKHVSLASFCLCPP